MQTTILLDHDIEGHAKYLQAGLTETDWDRDVTIAFVRLRDLGLPDDSSDQDIWKFAQQHRLLLITCITVSSALCILVFWTLSKRDH